MTLLMVTPYAPYRDGIANYAVQEVAALRASGHDVEVLSPAPSAAHHHLALGTPAGMARLARVARRYDRVIVQLYPDLLFGGCRSRNERLAVWLGLRALCAVTDVELRVHEIQYHEAEHDRRVRQLGGPALAAAAAVTVHTAPEQARLTEAFDLPPGTVTLVDHGSRFAKRCHDDRSTARASLGIPDDAFVFLSIGFVQRHKGFDRGVRALERLEGGADDRRLYVVGDIRIDHPDLLEYVEELSSLIASTDGAEFVRGYVSDELFDRWLVAADTLVLPYRQIWSSSVIERAALYDTPVIATDVGGLADQADAGTVVVADDDALAEAMAKACGARVRAGERAAPVPTTRADLQSLIAARSSRTAAREPLATLALTGTPRGVTGSPRPWMAVIKKVMAKLTNWQVDPVAGHLDTVIDALRDDVASLSARVAELERANAPSPTDDHH